MRAKYEEIAERLRRDIDAGIHTNRLPSERDLAKTLGTTNNTLRKAQNLLIAEGRLIKRQPQGTFITEFKPPKINVSFLLPLFTSEVLADMLQRFRDQFPDVDLEFHSRSSGTASPGECDLIGVPSVSPIPHQTMAVPFSADAIGQLPLKNYFEPAFEIHRDQGLYYGLPILFSPLVMLGDRESWDSAGFDSDPYGLNHAALTAMAKVARKSGKNLWPKHTAKRITRAVVFAAADGKPVLRDVDPDRCADSLRTWAPLLDPALIDGGDDAETGTDCLLTMSGRQGMRRFDPSKWRMFAWPVELRSRTMAVGEFLFLNRAGGNENLAARVALHFLSPEIQAIISDNGIGLPVLKSAAVDRVGTTPWRDDVFLGEVRNICANSASEYDFLHRLDALTEAWIDENIDFEAFIDAINGEIDLARRRHDLRRTFMTASAADDEELIAEIV